MFVITDDRGNRRDSPSITPQHSCGERGDPVERTPSCCDFCGNTENLQGYVVGDDESSKWYACADCAELIETDKWEQLVERSLSAYDDVRWTPQGEEHVVRKQVENLVLAFRAFRFVSV